jgi:hypothetical protein
MNTRIIVLLLALFTTTISFAQANLTAEQVTELTELKHQVDGTFQIQMIDTRSKPAIPLTLFKEINDRRHLTDIVYYQLNPKTRIKILPESTISDPNFLAPIYITHINSSEL